MPPKKGKKGKKGKHKKVPLVPPLAHVVRTFYELEIEDLKKKIDRLEHCTEANIVLENEIELLTENRTDDLGKKYFQLRDETTRMEETEDACNQLIKEHEEFLEEHHQQILRKDCEFVRMVENHKVNVLLKKSQLAQFEGVSLNSEAMLMRFQNAEKQYLEREAQQKEVLEKMEQSLESYKELVKQDVDRQLLKLSEEFVDKCKETIPKHTQRLIHENIALNNELDRINNTNQKLQNKIENALNFQSRKELLEKANHEMVIRCQDNLRRIGGLLKSVEGIEGIIPEYNGMRSLLVAFEVVVAAKLKEMQNFKFNVDILRRDVHGLTVQRENLKLELRLEKQNYEKYLNFKKKIQWYMEMLQSFDKQTPADEPFCPFDEKSFQRCTKAHMQQQLLDMLEQVNYVEEDSWLLKVDSVPSISNVYLVPNYGGFLNRSEYDPYDDDVTDKAVTQELLPRKKSHLHKLEQVEEEQIISVSELKRAPSVESVHSEIVIDVVADESEFFFEPSDAELSEVEEDEADEEEYNYSSSDG